MTLPPLRNIYDLLTLDLIRSPFFDHPKLSSSYLIYAPRRQNQDLSPPRSSIWVHNFCLFCNLASSKLYTTSVSTSTSTTTSNFFTVNVFLGENLLKSLVKGHAVIQRFLQLIFSISFLYKRMEYTISQLRQSWFIFWPLYYIVSSTCILSKSRSS